MALQIWVLMEKGQINFTTNINTLRPRQNGRHFADDPFKRIFLNENVWISHNVSLKFVPKGPIDNNPALVPIMAWRHSGDKPLSEPMMVSLLTHVCITRPQWVKHLVRKDINEYYSDFFVMHYTFWWAFVIRCCDIYLYWMWILSMILFCRSIIFAKLIIQSCWKRNNFCCV